MHEDAWPTCARPRECSEYLCVCGRRRHLRLYCSYSACEYPSSTVANESEGRRQCGGCASCHSVDIADMGYNARFTDQQPAVATATVVSRGATATASQQNVGLHPSACPMQACVTWSVLVKAEPAARTCVRQPQRRQQRVALRRRGDGDGAHPLGRLHCARAASTAADVCSIRADERVQLRQLCCSDAGARAFCAEVSSHPNPCIRTLRKHGRFESPNHKPWCSAVIMALPNTKRKLGLGTMLHGGCGLCGAPSKQKWAGLMQLQCPARAASNPAHGRA